MIYKFCFYRISNSALQDLKLNNKIYKLHDIITSIEEKKNQLLEASHLIFNRNFFPLKWFIRQKMLWNDFLKTLLERSSPMSVWKTTTKKEQVTVPVLGVWWAILLYLFMSIYQTSPLMKALDRSVETFGP